ncbi:MAG: hypothetical protein JXA28_00465 [Bacteroidetes bacterium]|nr:hypothetical protein [Bacteroidota bacterium]
MGYAIHLFTLAFCIAITTYRDMAPKMGWTIGEVYDPPTWPMSIGFVFGVEAIIFGFIRFAWWEALLMIPIGYLAAYFLTMGLRATIQWIGLIFAVIGGVLLPWI